MRKRLIIGAIAAVVIGVAVYFLSKPRKGSVEWHEREYWALQKGQSRLVLLIKLVAGIDPVGSTSNEERARLKEHEVELLKRGRLMESVVLVSNGSPMRVMAAARVAAGPTPWAQVTFFDLPGTNAIRMVTRTNDAIARLSRWERLIRHADVPASK